MFTFNEKCSYTITWNCLITLGFTGTAWADRNLRKKVRFANDNINNIKWRNGRYEKMLIKGVTKTIKKETKKQKIAFFGVLLSALGASLSGNVLGEKCFIWAVDGARSPKGQGTIGAGKRAAVISRIQRQDFKKLLG